MKLLRVRGKAIVEAELRTHGNRQILYGDGQPIDVDRDLYAVVDASSAEREQLSAAGNTLPNVLRNSAASSRR